MWTQLIFVYLLFILHNRFPRIWFPQWRMDYKRILTPKSIMKNTMQRHLQRFESLTPFRRNYIYFYVKRTFHKEICLSTIYLAQCLNLWVWLNSIHTKIAMFESNLFHCKLSCVITLYIFTRTFSLIVATKGRNFLSFISLQSVKDSR